jgi:hypothetical protein
MKVTYKLTENEVKQAIAEYLDERSADYEFSVEDIDVVCEIAPDGTSKVYAVAEIDDPSEEE